MNSLTLLPDLHYFKLNQKYKVQGPDAAAAGSGFSKALVFHNFFDMKDLEVQTRPQAGEFAVEQDGV
jgi:hypothetical protein